MALLRGAVALLALLGAAATSAAPACSGEPVPASASTPLRPPFSGANSQCGSTSSENQGLDHYGTSPVKPSLAPCSAVEADAAVRAESSYHATCSWRSLADSEARSTLEPSLLSTPLSLTSMRSGAVSWSGAARGWLEGPRLRSLHACAVACLGS